MPRHGLAQTGCRDVMRLQRDNHSSRLGDNRHVGEKNCEKKRWQRRARAAGTGARAMNATIVKRQQSYNREERVAR